MTWLAVTDHEERRLSLRGLGLDKQRVALLHDKPQTRLTRGSILFETRLPADARPQVLFGYKSHQAGKRSLTFQALPSGGIAMIQVQGEAICHAALQPKDAGRTDVVRITYSWDTDLNWGQLTLEKPEETQIISTDVIDPLPLALHDIRALMLGQEDAVFASDMIFAALSDSIEPIGPMPTLLPSTPIATPWGYKTASTLKRGATVLTYEDGTVPVLQNISRMVPARGSFRPIRLRAPYFGLQRDIIVSPQQRLLIEGPEVEYLFGHEAVLVPARHLINGYAALEEPCGPTICYTQLLLPRHESVLAAGTTAESLFIGRIRRNKALLHSSLLHSIDLAFLPDHASPARQILKSYDAVHLASRRAA